MKARHKDTGEIIELAEEGIISCDGRRFCWYQVELIIEPIDECKPFLPPDLDEAGDEYENKHTFQRYDGGGFTPEYNETLSGAFIAGAEWMAGQDKKEIEHAFFLGYNECEDRMKKEFEKRAMTGIINNIGYPTTIQLNTFDSSLKNGEEVIVQVIKK